MFGPDKCGKVQDVTHHVRLKEERARLKAVDEVEGSLRQVGYIPFGLHVSARGRLVRGTEHSYRLAGLVNTILFGVYQGRGYWTAMEASVMYY